MSGAAVPSSEPAEHDSYAIATTQRLMSRNDNVAAVWLVTVAHTLVRARWTYPFSMFTDKSTKPGKAISKAVAALGALENLTLEASFDDLSPRTVAIYLARPADGRPVDTGALERTLRRTINAALAPYEKRWRYMLEGLRRRV